MIDLKGKRGLVVGVANEASIAACFSDEGECPVGEHHH